MGGYILRRLGWSLVVVAAIVAVTFFATYILPADPARMIAGIRATPQDVERIRVALGLDQPFLVQLERYVSRLFQGDFGQSYIQNRAVLPLILERFPATLQLAAAGLAVELLIGLPLGILAATRRGTRSDRLSTILSIVLVSAPSFLVGYLLLNFLAFQPQIRFGMTIFPIGGYKPFDLRYLALPAITLGFSGAAYYTRLMRTSMLDELHRDYVRTARSKGLGERAILWRHAVRNALGPVLSQVGLDLGFFLGGVVIVERVFSWPGIGKLAVDSIVTADVPLILGTVLFGTVCIVAANLAVDVLQVVIDPRIRR
jgi:peptide/nickel transport system permease protein